MYPERNVQFNINCTSVYQSDTDSAMTLFDRYFLNGPASLNSLYAKTYRL